jgi:hypothetical protein
MNRYLLIGAVVVLLGIGGWVFFNQTSVTPMITEQSAQNPAAPQSPSKTSSSVEYINWHIERANPEAVEGYQKDEQAIFVDTTFTDGRTQRYSVGKASGCTSSTEASSDGHEMVLGYVTCYYALSGVNFLAIRRDGRLVIEKQIESARDGSIESTAVLEI